MSPAWARSGKPSDEKRIIRVAASGLTINGTLASLREQSNVGLRILPSILEPVIATDVLGDLSLQPGIAESWKRIGDSILEVKLRKGVLFHNGDEVTAEDVAFSFSREVMFGDTQPHRGDGAKTIAADDHARTTTTGTQCPPDVAAVGRRLWPSLEEVKVIDRYTVQFINAVPDSTLEGRLTRMGCDVISKRQYLESGDWNAWATAPVGTGPFKVKEHKPHQHLILERHEQYWGVRPRYTKCISMRCRSLRRASMACWQGSTILPPIFRRIRSRRSKVRASWSLSAVLS